MATALAAVLAVVIGRAREKQLEARDRHREKLAPLYEELVDLVRNADSYEEATQVEFYAKWSSQLVLYAPADIIKAWLTWLRTPPYVGGSPGVVPDDPAAAVPDPEVMKAWERVLRAIRSDLGHKDSDLGFGDLQRLYNEGVDWAFDPFKPLKS